MPGRGLGSRLLSHAVLIVFSTLVVLPLLWPLRVALTNNATAYRIPLEWGQMHLANFVEIFTGYPYSLDSFSVAAGATLVALPLAAGMAYAFARYNTSGLSLGALK